MWVLYGYGMITGLMATLHGIFQLLAAVGQWRRWNPQILIVQWTNVAALWRCTLYDMRKIIRSRCNLPNFAIEPGLLTYRVDD
jgi:hypothetical protein